MRKLLVPALIIAFSVAGCSSLRFPGVYRIDISQGNFVTSEMTAQLKPGMSPDQVRYVLGMPMLVDPFTPGQWFYLMSYRPGDGKPVRQEIIVHFDDEGRYSHYEGEVIEDLQRRTQAPKDRELQEKARRQKEDAADGDLEVEEEPTPVDPIDPSPGL